MKPHFLAMLAFAGLFAGAAHAETRDLRGFSGVAASGRYTVDVVMGAEYSVEITGSDAARIRTRVQDGVLKIEPVNRPWFGPEPRYDVRVRVSTPSLESVAAARGARMNAVLSGPCRDFSAAAAMGAELVAEGLQCETVDAAAAMGAEMTLSGSCGALDLSAAMGAEVRAEDLHCRTLDASAAMGADVHAYASQSYDASAAMGGSINVAGNPTVADRSSAMGGSITQDKP